MADAKKSLRKKQGTLFPEHLCKRKSKYKKESAYKDMEMKHQNYTQLLDSEDEDHRKDLAEKEEDMERINQEFCAARTD